MKINKKLVISAVECSKIVCGCNIILLINASFHTTQSLFLIIFTSTFLLSTCQFLTISLSKNHFYCPFFITNFLNQVIWMDMSLIFDASTYFLYLLKKKEKKSDIGTLIKSILIKCFKCYFLTSNFRKAHYIKSAICYKF